jgi:ParB/RepB/Spo0J family partition protein
MTTSVGAPAKQKRAGKLTPVKAKAGVNMADLAEIEDDPESHEPEEPGTRNGHNLAVRKKHKVKEPDRNFYLQSDGQFKRAQECDSSGIPFNMASREAQDRWPRVGAKVSDPLRMEFFAARGAAAQKAADDVIAEAESKSTKQEPPAGFGLDGLSRSLEPGQSLVTSAATGTGKLVMISIGRLREHPQNPRKEFGRESMAELLESIKVHGVLTPLLVRTHPSWDPKSDCCQYQVLAGHRRLRAAREAGLAELPCLVRECDDKTALEILLLDNLQREGLSPLDEAFGYRQAIDSGEFTADTLAARIGKSRRYIFNRLALCKLSEPVRVALIAGSIDHSKALVLSRVQDEKKQLHWLEESRAGKWDGDEGWSCSRLEQAIHGDKKSQRDLKDAPWKLDTQFGDAGNASEVVIKGMRRETCAVCPLRLGNDPTATCDPKSANALMCTDPKCYGARERAWGCRLGKKVAEQGFIWFGHKPGLFSMWNNYRLTSNKDYVAPDDKPSGSKKTWREIFNGQPKGDWLGKAADAKWNLHFVIAVTTAVARAKECGFKIEEASPAAARMSYAEEQKQREERALPFEMAAMKAIPMVVAAAEKAKPETLLRLLIGDRAQVVATRRKLKQKDLDRLPVSELFGLLIEFDFCRHPVETWSGRWNDRFVEACKALKVDLAGLLAEFKDAQKKGKK